MSFPQHGENIVIPMTWNQRFSEGKYILMARKTNVELPWIFGLWPVFVGISIISYKDITYDAIALNK